MGDAGFNGFDDPFDQFFGFGIGDEDGFVDIELHAGEPAFVEDILNGTVVEKLSPR